MRKIEKEMVAAIKAGKSWNKDNTQVTVNVREDGATITSVYLHGNLIAQTGKDGTWGFCLCGWNTPTTRSRINAVIHCVFPADAPGIASHKGAPVKVMYNVRMADAPHSKPFTVRVPLPLCDWFSL